MKPNVRPIPIDVAEVERAAADLTAQMVAFMRRHRGGVRLGKTIAKGTVVVKPRTVLVDVVTTRPPRPGPLGASYFYRRKSILIWLSSQAYLDIAMTLHQEGPDAPVLLERVRRGARPSSLFDFIRDMLIHEVTHAADIGLWIDHVFGGMGTGDLPIREHARDPKEIAAYTQQIIQDVLRAAKTMRVSEFESPRSYVEHLIEMSPRTLHLEMYLDDSALNKIYKTAYQALINEGHL